MKCSLVLLSVASILFFWTAGKALAQSADVDSPKTWIALKKLSPPVFPPIARAARIMGDVRVRMTIRRDGSVVSAEVANGPPMLKQAALDSAEKSSFFCENCSHEVTEYFLTYTFGFRNDNDCGIRKLRSSKCLYLWHCGIWEAGHAPAPVLGESLDRVVILADSMCVETSHSNGGR